MARPDLQDSDLERAGSLRDFFGFPIHEGEIEKRKPMTGQSCLKCGRYLPPGSLKYVVHIRVFAGFDGYLSIPDEDLDGEMDRILEEIESRNPDDLEREVYQEIGLLL